MNTHRYNIALLPTDESLHLVFAKIAEDFRELADGYILGDKALAHVTLCQFFAGDDDKAMKTFNLWRRSPPLTLSLLKFQLDNGKAEHTGKFWATISVEKSLELIKLQKNCVEHLKREGFETRTSIKEYNPHLTLARLSGFPSHQLQFSSRPVEFRTAIGFSTETGMFVREIN